MEVNGLRIPASLCRLINAGVWPTVWPNGQELNPILGPDSAHRLSPEDDRIILALPPFRTIADEVIGGNQFWVRDLSNVGEIAYDKAVIIADFGLGSDSPIILYYGLSTAPVVMYLKWSCEGPTPVHSWVQTHESFEDFAQDVGLG